MPEPIVLVHRAQAYPHSMPSRWGAVLDVRWTGSFLVLEHDLYSGYREAKYEPMYLEAWLDGNEDRPVFAWNIREDGVEKRLAEVLLKEFPEVGARSFVFGASYATLRAAKALGLPTAPRISEEEPWEMVPGCPTSHCWLDRWDWASDVAYYEPNQSPEDFAQQRIYVPQQARVWAVSPETHVGHSPWFWLQHHWRVFFRLGVAGICTDHPEECERAYQQWQTEGAR